MRKSLILFFVTVPNPIKLLLILLSAASNPVKFIPLPLLVLPMILGLIILPKITVSGNFSDLFWVIKPFFLIPGLIVGRHLSDGDVFVRARNTKIIIGLILLLWIICLLQFGGFDVWSGSGSFGTRSTLGFKGFGEAAIIIFFAAMSKYFLLTLLLTVVTGSKLLILSAIAGHIVALFYLKSHAWRSLLVLCVLCILSIMYVNDTIYTIIEIYAESQYYSIIACGADCSSYTNRTNATLDLFNLLSLGYPLLIGGIEENLFLVQPEVALLYYLKIYGLLGPMVFFLIFLYCGRRFWSLVFVCLLMLDVYSLSPIGYFLIGITISVQSQITYLLKSNHKRRNKSA